MSAPAPGPRRTSLRRRLFLVLALTALACVATTVTVTAVLQARAARQARVSALARQADATAAAVAATRTVPFAQLRVLVAAAPGRPVRAAARRRAQAVRAALPNAGDGEGSIGVGGRELLYALRGTPAGSVVLVRPTARQAGDVRPLGAVVLLPALAGLLLAGLLAALLARRLVRPIAALTQATRPIARGESPQQLPERGPRELAELAHAFNAMGAELEIARDAERRFLLTVSHELRTPLTSIRGYAEALADGHVDGPGAAPVLEAEAHRLERLVADLLELARVGSSAFSVADEDVDLAAVAAAAVERHAAAARRARVALVAGPAEPARARGDAARLLQAASNLVENALRVTAPGGRVTVTAHGPELAVIDTGPGLDAESRARAFERFHLHRRGPAARAGTSGLGLALVAELTAAMGGTAAAEPGLDGTGTRFVLRLRPTRGA